MTYASQRDAFSHTKQELVVVGVRECQNHYSIDWHGGGHALQWILHSESIDNAAWTKTSVTVTPDTIEAPDGTMTADEVAFNATNDAFTQTAVGANGVVTSRAWTGSIFMKIPTGTETVTLRVTNAGGTEAGDVQVTLTDSWQRFFMHKLFSGTPTDNATLTVIRLAGDSVSTLHAWGGNLSRNPGDQDRVIKWPYRANNTGSASLLTTFVSRCSVEDAGDGARCMYSRPTCQDPDNFNAGNVWESEPRLQGIREYRFCKSDAAIPTIGEDVYPYLTGVPSAAQKIEPERAVTVNARITFEFDDDASPGLWNPRQQSEGGLVNTQSGAGTFWRRWSTIYRGFSNPECYVDRKVGFVESGVTEADFQTRGRYLMKRLQFDDRKARLVCTDRLKLTRKSMPGTLSSSNVLRFPMQDVQNLIELEDCGEIPTPAVNAAQANPDYVVTLEIEPGTANSEKVNVTSIDIDANEATIQRGRWGTQARSHPVMSEVRVIYEFGTERTDTSGVPLGKNTIDCLREMYMFAGIDYDEFDHATFDSERDTWLFTLIDPSTGSSYGPAVRRTLTETIEVEKLAGELRELTGLMVFVTQGKKISCRMFAPVVPGTTVATLTDDANIVSGSVSLEEDDEERISRVLIGYDIGDGDDVSGDAVEDYARVRVEVDASAESRNYYGEPRQKVLLTKWLEPTISTEPIDSAAAYFTSHVMSRFRHGRRVMKAELSIKDDDIEVGDPVRVQTSHIQDEHGNDYDGTMYVTSKRVSGNKITIEAIDTFGVLERAWFYADTGLPDYDSANDDDRVTAYLADSFGMVGTGTNRRIGYKAT